MGFIQPVALSDAICSCWQGLVFSRGLLVEGMCALRRFFLLTVSDGIVSETMCQTRGCEPKATRGCFFSSRSPKTIFAAAHDIYFTFRHLAVLNAVLLLLLLTLLPLTLLLMFCLPTGHCRSCWAASESSVASSSIWWISSTSTAPSSTTCPRSQVGAHGEAWRHAMSATFRGTPSVSSNTYRR